ncbi:lysis protein [Scandinavium sp. H17S15]|nr:lysis protein [Scandinavium manionii]
MLIITAKIARNNYDRAIAAEHELKLSAANVKDMQVRQRSVAALDAKYTGELASAQATIDKLQRDVAAGDKRLRLNATCKPVSKSARSTGVDDATSPGLTDAAERDYFTLRDRIETSEKIISGLQDYIKHQCLKPMTSQ